MLAFSAVLTPVVGKSALDGVGRLLCISMQDVGIQADPLQNACVPSFIFQRRKYLSNFFKNFF